MIVLETERLVLRHLTLNDAKFIVELLNDPSFLRYIGDRKVRNEQDARRYLLDGPIASYLQHGFGLNLVFLKETGDPLGMCGLLKRDVLPDPDIGFAFLPSWRRRGYAGEAAAAVLEQGRTHFGLKRIVAITSPDNQASMNLLEKLGMKFEALIRLGEDAQEVRRFGLNFVD